MSESLLQQNKDWNFFFNFKELWDSDVWIPSPTKQGLKLELYACNRITSKKSESLLQQNKDWNQGLYWESKFNRYCLNPFSNKTRIETQIKAFRLKCFNSLNPFSNKTRIETEPAGRAREYSPLGLNPFSNKTRIETRRAGSPVRGRYRVWIPSPTKQGLKQMNKRRVEKRPSQSESLLQQNKDWNQSETHHECKFWGCLNPFSNKTRIETKTKEPKQKEKNKVWIPSPTKQGLKPNGSTYSGSYSCGLNPFSNKTRIETGIKDMMKNSIICLNPFSNKTRIETESVYFSQ